VTNRSLAKLTAIVIVLATFAGGCSRDKSEENSTPITTAAIPLEGKSPEHIETSCLSPNPKFTNRGTTSVLGGTRPDAHQLSGIDWIVTSKCERIVFSFVTNHGAPASQIGLSRLEFEPEQRILRIEMPRDVNVSAVANARIEGTLTERAFVVRSQSGSLSVDLHLSDQISIKARGLIVDSPARLIIDLQPDPDGNPIEGSPPIISRDIVVLAPAAGEINYPLRVRGYARTRSDLIIARLESTGPNLERRVATAPSSDSWGEFATTISEGPSGDVTLIVAEEKETFDNSDAELSIPLLIP